MLLCFGTNGCGQFGAQTPASTKLNGERADCSRVSARVLLPKDLGGHIPRTVSASPTCTALVTDNGKCLCLGLSPLHTTANIGRIIVAPAFDTRFRRIACGHAHVLAVTDRGELWGWGDNSCRQLGSTSAPEVKRPEKPRAMVNCKVIGIAAGKRHSIALGDTGVAYSWGCNEYGQLGVIAEGEVDASSCGAASCSADSASQKSIVTTKEAKVSPKSDFTCKAAAQRVAVDAPLASVAAGWEHSAFVTQTGVIFTCGFGMSVVTSLVLALVLLPLSR